LAADRAEQAADRVVSAANELSDVVGRLMGRLGHGNLPAALTKQPDEIEVRVGEAAESPLTRAADAVVRAVESVGGTLYDYSAGRYGMPPLTAQELRQERKKESKEARPVAIIEGRYTGAPRGRRGFPWLVLLAVGAGLAAAIAVSLWQRRRLQQATSQAIERGRLAIRQAGQQMQQGQPHGSAQAAPISPATPSGASAPGSLANRRARGDALPRSGTSATPERAQRAEGAR
jgi:hypothetical protein